MKRAARLHAVQHAMYEEQRAAAARLAHKQQIVRAATSRLTELIQYRADYYQSLEGEAGRGLTATRLRNYQSFLAKLDQAVQAQRDLLARAHAEADFELSKLRDLSGQIVAVKGVADRWTGEERRHEERLEQRGQDEFSQRARWQRDAGD